MEHNNFNKILDFCFVWIFLKTFYLENPLLTILQFLFNKTKP